MKTRQLYISKLILINLKTTMNLTLYIFIALSLVIVSSCSKNAEDQSIAHKRHIALEGQPNFRDLGGYQTKDGRILKWGQVYRSGELPKVTDSDLKILDSLQLHTVVNFLTPKEIDAHGPDRLPEGIREIPNPMNTEGVVGKHSVAILQSRKTGDFSNVPAEFNPEIHRLLIDVAKKEYADLLRSLLQPENMPLVFHCSHGVHRTGTGAAILLSALGVPWETIREDYLLSNKYRKEEVEKRIGELKKLARTNPDITDHEQNDKNIEAFYILQGAYVDAALDEAVKQYGSMENFIKEGLGISDNEVERLKAALLE
jgi:protein-tyrosine phosphatase